MSALVQSLGLDAARAEATLAHGARAFDEAKLAEVLEDGQTVEAKTRHLGGVVEEVKLLWRLLADYARGHYRAPWRFIAAVGFAFLYLILPIDIIPDFLPGLGYLDDASVFGMVLRASQIEIAAYQAWLAAQAEATPMPTLEPTATPEPTEKPTPDPEQVQRQEQAAQTSSKLPLYVAVGIAVVCAGIVAAVLISRQLQNTQAQTRKQKDEKSAYHRKKGGK